jgi:hypothetical protein
MERRGCLLAALPLALCGLNRGASAQTDLSPIVVIATRVPESSFDLPVSVDRVSQDEIQKGHVEVNISRAHGLRYVQCQVAGSLRVDPPKIHSPLHNSCPPGASNRVDTGRVLTGTK